jgi:hypothetical protein
VDDAATVIAARACQELGLAHNAPDASYEARDKHLIRQRLSAAGVLCPRFRLYHTDDDPTRVAPAQTYPCVVKPTQFSASRGVIRANDPGEFVAAFTCTRAIVLGSGGEPGQGGQGHILVEDYIPGVEVVLEGILARGALGWAAAWEDACGPALCTGCGRMDQRRYTVLLLHPVSQFLGLQPQQEVPSAECQRPDVRLSPSSLVRSTWWQRWLLPRGTILARARAGWGWFGFPYVMPPVLSRPCHRQFLDGIGNRAQHASARGETDIAKLARPAGRFRLQHGADEEASDKLTVSSDG